MAAGFAQFLSIASLLGLDQHIAGWFHVRLNEVFARILFGLSFPGSPACVAAVLSLTVPFLAWTRRWRQLAWLLVTLPGGMLLGDLLKLLVQRRRPYLVGPFVDWSGYSFPSGHTIAATLLCGVFIAFCRPILSARCWRATVVAIAISTTLLVGFSRIALGAHYLTDVLGAIMLGSLWLMLCSNIIRTHLPTAQAELSPADVAPPYTPRHETPEQDSHHHRASGDCGDGVARPSAA
jgi:undecaprenyl-diphosphatase